MSIVYDAALAAYRRAEGVFENPRIQSSPSSLALSQPLVEVRPDWARAAELGMAAGEVGYTVAALTDGAFVCFVSWVPHFPVTVGRELSGVGVTCLDSKTPARLGAPDRWAGRAIH